MSRLRTRAELVRIRDYGLDRLNDQMNMSHGYDGQSDFWKIIHKGTADAWIMFREGEYVNTSETET